MKKTTFAITFLAMAMLCSVDLTASLLQTTSPAPSEELKKGRNSKFLKAISEIPNITEAQKSKILEIHERYRKENIVFKKENKPNTLTQTELASMSSAERAEYHAREKQYHEAAAERRAAERSEIEKVLTEEQILWTRLRTAQK